MINLAELGSFYINGKEIDVREKPIKEVYRNPQFPALKVDPNGKYIIEQMYVQYFIPTNKQKYPIIFVPGGGLTGSCWETTPDGRKGWLSYFLEQNYACYVVDSVGLGRSGWCSISDIWKEAAEMRTAQRTWEVFRLGKIENFEQKEFYSDSQFPKDYFNNLLKYNVPRWNETNKIFMESLSSLISKIGECIIISHSQSAEAVLYSCEKHSNLVKKLVLLEPASFPNVVDYSLFKNINFLFIYGDYIDNSPYWKKMFENGHLFYTELVKYGNNKVEWLDLPGCNIQGNSHMLMMDMNNHIIADYICAFFNNKLILNQAQDIKLNPAIPQLSQKAKL